MKEFMVLVLIVGTTLITIGTSINFIFKIIEVYEDERERF